MGRRTIHINGSYFEKDDDSERDRTIYMGNGTYNESFSYEGDFVQGDKVEFGGFDIPEESPIDLSNGDFVETSASTEPFAEADSILDSAESISAWLDQWS